MKMSVYELSKEQLTELKEQMYMNTHNSVSYAELVNVNELISDEEVENCYSDTCFTEDDFFWKKSESCELILDYDNMQVVLDTETGKYYWYNYDEEYHAEKREVVLVATLKYDICNDIQVDEDASCLQTLFHNDCCGEAIFDDHIEYLWFKCKE
jgi:hypothetical protein